MSTEKFSLKKVEGREKPRMPTNIPKGPLHGPQKLQKQAASSRARAHARGKEGREGWTPLGTPLPDGKGDAPWRPAVATALCCHHSTVL